MCADITTHAGQQSAASDKTIWCCFYKCYTCTQTFKPMPLWFSSHLPENHINFIWSWITFTCLKCYNFAFSEKMESHCLLVLLLTRAESTFTHQVNQLHKQSQWRLMEIFGEMRWSRFSRFTHPFSLLVQLLSHPPIPFSPVLSTDGGSHNTRWSVYPGASGAFCLYLRGV